MVAVVVHHREPELLARTLAGLVGQSEPPEHVIVVDNSGDVRPVVPGSLPASCSLVIADKNAGYGHAMNIGLRAILPGLSPDTGVLLLTHEALLARDACARLYQALDLPGTAITAPLLGRIEDPELTWSVGGEIDGRYCALHLNPNESICHHEVRPSFTVDWADGAALMVRASALQHLGVFDERFFMYFEEVELCARFRRAGWFIRLVPSAIAWQAPGNMGRRLAQRNRLLFVELSYSRRRAWSLARADLRRILKDPGGRREAILGVADYALRRWQVGRPR